MPRIRPALLALLLAATPAAAQAGINDEAAPRTLLSAGVAAGRGDGPLGTQLGGSFRSVRRLDALGRVGLRVEGGALLAELQEFELPESEAGELLLRNTLVFAGAGPQVQLPRGPVRPYAHAFGGLHYIFTRTDTEVGGAPGITTTYEDFAWAYGGGAGVYVAQWRGMLVDAGVTWRSGGEVTYATFETGPARTDTDLLMAHLGVAIEL